MRPGMIVEPAPAKINLALHVRRRRPDGYHDLETLFAFCAQGDTVTVARAESPSLTITGPFASSLPGGAENLVSAAAASFRDSFRVPDHHAIALEKRLPVASGIGGGSSDAAATLRALARMYGRPLDHPVLVQCAASLGADVPACLFGRTAFGTGKGDALTPLDPLGNVPVLLVNPGIGVSTAAVFARWDGLDRGGLATLGSPVERAQSGRNDLEAPARALAPAIDDVLTVLNAAEGASLVRMSGSGATCFALFDTPAARDRTRDAARDRDWWTLATTVT